MLGMAAYRAAVCLVVPIFRIRITAPGAPLCRSIKSYCMPLYLQAICGGVGVFVFQTWMNNWSFRTLFWVSFFGQQRSVLGNLYSAVR